MATIHGVFIATFTSVGLAQLKFPSRHQGSAVRPLKAVPAEVRCWSRATRIALQAVFRGARPVELPPMDWVGSTVFQRRVWQALLQLPAGRTVTYAELARRIEHPAACRAVGAACGANPVPVLVPCHRVVSAGGGLGGFSGGLGWKRKLLAAEGIRLLVGVTSLHSATR